MSETEKEVFQEQTKVAFQSVMRAWQTIAFLAGAITFIIGIGYSYANAESRIKELEGKEIKLEAADTTIMKYVQAENKETMDKLEELIKSNTELATKIKLILDKRIR